jgi:hypothetical protein
VLYEQLGKGDTGKLTALIRIEDLGLALPFEHRRKTWNTKIYTGIRGRSRQTGGGEGVFG